MIKHRKLCVMPIMQLFILFGQGMTDMGEREHRYVVALAACHVPAMYLP